MIRNHQLFSQAYLRELQTAKGAVELLDACRQTIREWRQEFPSLDRLAELRAYVEQCLSALTVAYSPRDQGDGWTLYSDAAKEQPTALCLAIQDEDLGRAVKGRHHQVRLVRVLREAGLHWGVLTNGHQWRLCHASGPAPYEEWLEVNLDDILSSNDLTPFHIVHRFFGAAAFVVSPYDPPPPPLALIVPLRIGLDLYRDQSNRRTATIERHLKTCIEPILQRLCLGFVEADGAKHYSSETLHEIYRNAIYLLYRILFLFYAEARELLPLADPRYRPHSLAAIVEASRKRQEEGAEVAEGHSLWNRLDHLFGLVDLGDDTVGVAAYNGGLFSRLEKNYLNGHQLGDQHLAPTLYALAFETPETGPVPIDYRDLSVRHLGTLYEGMLEYRLNRVTGEPCIVRDSGGSRRYVSLSEAGPIKKGDTVLGVGDVYFADDKGERKASGSYYTPEDVVQYIVKNTVSPKLEERRSPVLPILEVARRMCEFAATPEERTQLERYADNNVLETVNREILGLRFLDPAMGSGHFLVAAAQLTTDFCLETLNLSDWANEDVSTDPALWKRRVVERCLYGVDKNSLAVDLAKLALWIASASQGKPLTFLDHHLKTGNSLYGTPLSQMATLPTRKKQRDDPLFRLSRERIIQETLQCLAEIANRDTEDVATAKEKALAYRAAMETTLRIRDVANVWLASLFTEDGSSNATVTEQEYSALLDELPLNHTRKQWETIIALNPTLLESRTLAREEGFFHWELEFPDALEAGVCQFDAVMANPPYVGLSPTRSISALYETAECCDLYAWLYERCAHLTQSEGGVFGAIVPLSITFSRQLKALRKKILSAPVSATLTHFDATRDGIFRNGQRATIAIHRYGVADTCLMSSNLLRWDASERPYLIPSASYAEITSLASESGFPKIGDPELVEFWRQIHQWKRTVGQVACPFGSGRLAGTKGKGADCPSSLPKLYVSSNGRYFITALPYPVRDTGFNVIQFENESDRDIALLALNSNVFYWLWCATGDGFHITIENLRSMILPLPDASDKTAKDLYEGLLNSTSECATFHSKWGIKIPNYNFNRRMDILVKIDRWIIDRVAPGANISVKKFAQFKQHSCMKYGNFDVQESLKI